MVTSQKTIFVSIIYYVHIGLTQQVYKLESSGPSEPVIAKSRPTSTSVAISIEFQDQERHTP